MRIYVGGYGHNPTGQKQYAYWGGDNYRTGQEVVAPVTHPVSGRTYNTMFKIQIARSSNSEYAKKPFQHTRRARHSNEEFGRECELCT